MNETINNIKNRRSIRKYKNEMIPQKLVDEILEAGTYAPSGMNRQPSIIISVTNKEVRDKLSRLNAKIMGSVDIDPFYGAPVVLIVLADKSCPTYIYDGSLVMSNLMLAAHSLNIDSCWIHRAKEMFETEEGKEILKSLGIEGEYEGIGNCILGYRDCEEPKVPPRKENYIYRM
ncbi:MAG: nitroreductase [Bacilli bacterium]|nr:nitroreductase [Bacilli bacterium]